MYENIRITYAGFAGGNFPCGALYGTLYGTLWYTVVHCISNFKCSRNKGLDGRVSTVWCKVLFPDINLVYEYYEKE